MSKIDFEAERKRLVYELVAKGIVIDKEVIRAMLTVPREEFVLKKLRSKAYLNTHLSLEHGKQTISAPNMVAMMCELLELKVGDKVLEVGTGSGYHAAVAAEIVAPKNAENRGHIYTVEIIEELANFARKNLEKTLYINNVTVVHGDGSLGLPEHAPFNKIFITAAAPEIPKPLIEQLMPGGILLSPVEQRFRQTLQRLRKTHEGKIETSELYRVAFVHLRGKYGLRG